MPHTSIHSLLAQGHDLKASVGQGLEKAFRDLFSFLWIDPVVWVIFERIANHRIQFGQQPSSS
jgi:hypothetical protein